MSKSRNETGKILRGAALALAGAVMIWLSTGCADGKKAPEASDNWPKVIYSDGCYQVVQDTPVHKPSQHEGLEYVFIPLTLTNDSDHDIIFSSYVCVKSYAMPSGCVCLPADKDAVALGKTQVEHFRLFDGLIPVHSETSGWLAFELPKESDAVHVDFRTGGEGEFLSFDCNLSTVF